MHDNKVRLSRDVLEKAEAIAAEWGLKNARAAIEAVFRRYCNDYQYGREPAPPGIGNLAGPSASLPATQPQPAHPKPVGRAQCEALDALDDLLAL